MNLNFEENEFHPHPLGDFLSPGELIKSHFPDGIITPKIFSLFGRVDVTGLLTLQGIDVYNNLVSANYNTPAGFIARPPRYLAKVNDIFYIGKDQEDPGQNQVFVSLFEYAGFNDYEVIMDIDYISKILATEFLEG